MNNNWLDIELLEDYLDGKLDSKAMHQIERQALEDPFVAQALAGLSESPRRAEQSVSLLQKQLYERIAQQQVQKKDSVYTWQRLSVAAAAAVMFISVSIIFFMRDKQNREQIAKGQPRRVEVNMAPTEPVTADSIKGDTYAANMPAKTAVPVAPVKYKVIKEKIPAVVAETNITDTATVNNPVAMAKTAGVNARIATVAPAVSAPIGGWASLDSYISDNNKFKGTNSGKFVELSFLIDKEGKPSDIRVTKGAEKELDEEAIRLIKEGPRWEQPTSSEHRVIYTIGF